MCFRHQEDVGAGEVHHCEVLIQVDPKRLEFLILYLSGVLQ